jgi:hypothetical protein
MKVRTLQLFLRSLRPAVTAADGNSPLPSQLDAVSEGLEPFAALDFGQFAAFLRQAEQYRTSGTVPMPPAASPAMEKVLTSLREVDVLAEKLSGAGGLDAQQIASRQEAARRNLEQALVPFLKPLAVSAALKSNPKELTAALKKAEIGALTAQVLAALDGVSDEASLNAPERQEKLRGLAERHSLGDLKAVAKELKAPASGRTPEAVVSGIVAQVTGIKPAAKKKQGSRTLPVDQEVVRQQAVKLRGLLEKSLDPGGLSSADIEAAIGQLEPRSAAELQAVAHEVGLPNVGTKKAAILKKLRDKLREADRARESIQV